MDQELKEAIDKAIQSGGYLVTITRLHGIGKLAHTNFVNRFPTDDIPKSLDEHKRILSL